MKFDKKNIISITLSIIFVIVLFWSMFSKIIINEELFIYGWNNFLAVILTILALIFIRYKYKTDEKFIERLKNQNQSILKAYIAILIGIPLFTKMLTEKVLFTILHNIYNQPSEKTVFIDKAISQKHCRHGIKLIGYKNLGNGKICGIPQNILDKLKHNQKITLYGEESIFGFIPESFSYEDDK